MNSKKPVELPDFSDLHLIVIGDVMIDRYIKGSVKRISPEAPVPVVEMENIENRLGGAANVAINLQSLGAQVTLISIVGDDDEGEHMIRMSTGINGLEHKIIKIGDRKTTVKTRIMSGNQHILRIDKEDISDIKPADSEKIINILKLRVAEKKTDGIIFQDYNKGMLTEDMIKKIITFSHEQSISTFVDPKEKNFFSYTGCTIFKPNKKEIYKAIPEKTTDLDVLDKILRSTLDHQITVVTLGADGIYIHDGMTGRHFKTSPRSIIDVCGAGDSVISVVSLCYLKKMDLETIAYIANTAGGQVCETPGVSPVRRELLQEELFQD